MALLGVSSLQKSFGAELLFENVSFEIQENDRIGLVGVNGSGKTTLFRILTEELFSDGGELFKSQKTIIGYMEQHVCKEEGRKAYDEVLTVFSELSQMEVELEELHLRISQRIGNLDRLVERQTELQERYISAGGLTYKNRTRSALLGLGFDDIQMKLSVGALSGGQKAKLQLAKMLLSGANLLLLDEPTNHLDIRSVEWLEDFLKNYHGAYLVISHDRYFLDKVTSRTFEMENGHLTVYKGNYTAFLKQREERRLTKERQYVNTSREIARLEGVVAQQRQWNREKNIKTAESKLKVIERLERSLEIPDKDPESMRFHFSINRVSGNDVLQAEDISLGFNGSLLFEKVDLHIKSGERIFLLGPNGCGKTSLFKTLLGIYTPQSGYFRFGAGVEVGYYDQIQSGLNSQKTVIDEVWDKYPKMTQTEVRNALAVFLFQGEDVFKLISKLSGGERARVLLLQLMLSRANFLMLDEPTNHLDIASREALENALESYEGTLFIISHDRYLINKAADRIYYLDQNGVSEYVGSYDNFLQRQALLKAEVQIPKREKNTDYKRRKEQESERRKLKTRQSRAEESIHKAEEQLHALGERLELPEIAQDYEQVLSITREMDELKARLEGLYEEWSSVSEQLEEAEE